MAPSAHLREELTCSICLDIYRDPTTLACGHNFCRACIHRVLDKQKRSGAHSCPECRKTFKKFPALQKNIKLSNIVENFRSTQPDQDKNGVFCTYCIHSPIPAVMSCLMCEASLCEDHLKVHSKAPDHVLCDPTTSLVDRKCSVHKKVLEYYCSEDAACICVSCRLDGEHRAHQAETLQEASEKKKKKLRNVLQKLLAETVETEKRVQILQEHRRKLWRKAQSDAKIATVLFKDLRKCLEDLEKRVLINITRQTEQASIPATHQIQKLEEKKQDLSRKIRHIKKLCDTTDPLSVLRESHTGDYCDMGGADNDDREKCDKLIHAGGDLGAAGISHALYAGLSDIIIGVCRRAYIPEAADILLDVNTANNYLYISGDQKTACWTDLKQKRPERPERFQKHRQVMSVQSFSSGRRYWEVEVGRSSSCRVGMCYATMEREEGNKSIIGLNKKSWGLDLENNQCAVMHDRIILILSSNITSNRVRIYLDYEAGRISFYDLCNPIRHLHTFTAAFTEPLHAVLCVAEGYVKMSEEPRRCEVSTQPLLTLEEYLRSFHRSLTDRCALH
ncbi:E3 ubiquitin/ISG15 ligase TRIM25-like [Hyperolius riggenbachi]|uniref:E3 ubiquitin/ISG15 ligase TRIM25-like n=1 Tax=Hyperolius riggenbachi TaxID=752182 RepID=UPI0035A2EB22